MQFKTKAVSLFFVILLGLALVVTGCGGDKAPSTGDAGDAPQEEKIVLKLGELNPDTHVMTIAFREFAKIVDEKSN
ncbi:MAG: hypothetical protein SCK28_05870, partial [Bacillota bacterium]|nr:hypothetical protein [Bacillota bacterium]